MKHFLSVSKKLVAVCLAVLLAVVTVPALSVSADPEPTYDFEVVLHGNGGTDENGEETVTINYIDWKFADYNDVFTREGYYFAEWQYYSTGNVLSSFDPDSATDALQSVENYLAEKAKTSGNDPVHLYAAWEDRDYYSVCAEIGSVSALDYANNADYEFDSDPSKNLFYSKELGFDEVPAYISDLLSQSDKTTIDGQKLVERKLGWHYVNENNKLVKLSSDIVTEDLFTNGYHLDLVYVIIHDTYTISYDLKGGSWDVNQQKVVENEGTYLTPTLSVPEPKKAGYNFTGWTVIDVKSGDTLTETDEEIYWSGSDKGTLEVEVLAEKGIKLVANWATNKVITYANTDYFTAEGLAYLDSKSQFVSTLTLPAALGGDSNDLNYSENGYIKDGYKFLGWATTSTGSSYITTANATQTVYAVVTFDVVLTIDGLENVYTNKTFGDAWANDDGKTYKTVTNNVVNGYTLPTLYKKGYTFAGWALYKVGNSGEAILDKKGNNVIDTVYAAGTKISAPISNGTETKLHAQWTRNEYTIKYNLNGADYIAYPSVLTVANEEKFYIDSTPNNASLYTAKFYAYTDDSVWYLKGTSTPINSLSELQTYIINNYATLKSTEFELVAVFPEILTEKDVYVVLHLNTILGTTEDDNAEYRDQTSYDLETYTVYTPATSHYYEVDYNYTVIKDLFVNTVYIAGTDNEIKPDGYADTEFKLANYIIDLNNVQAVEYLVNGVEVTYTESLAHANGYDYKEYDTSGAEFVGPEYGLEALTDTDALKAFNRISSSYSYKAMRKTTAAGSYSYFIAADGSDTNFTGAKVQTRSYTVPELEAANNSNVYVLKVKDANGVWRYFLRVDTARTSKVVHPYANLTKKWSDNATYSISKTADLTVSDTTKIVKDLAAGYRFTGWIDAEGNAVSKLGANDLSRAHYNSTTSHWEIDLFATWIESSTVDIPTLFKLTYELNGGELDNKPNYVYFVSCVDKIVLATYCEATKFGYNLTGFGLAVDGTGAVKQYLYNHTTANELSQNVFASASSLKDIKVYAKWTADVLYNLTGNAASDEDVNYKFFDFNGGTLVANSTQPTQITIEKNIDLSKVVLTKGGYTFLGWYNIPQETKANVYAQYIYDSSAKKLSEISYEDVYENGAWSNEGEQNLGAVAYAWWSKNYYTISYNLNGGTVASNPTVFAIGSSVTVNAPTKVGYKFKGWRVISNNNQIIELAENGTLSVEYSAGCKDVELEALWVAKTYDVTFSNIYSQFNNNANNNTDDYEYGKVYTFYDLVIKTDAYAKNYEFIGWYNVDQNSTYLDLINKGYGIEYIRSAYGEDIKKVQTSEDLGIAANVQSYQIFAWYRTVTDYVKVSFDYDGGVIDTKTYVAAHELPEVLVTSKVAKDVETDVTTPILVKTGYAFLGWYSNTVTKELVSDDYDIIEDQTLTEDTVYHAKWELIKAIAISYDCAGGQLTAINNSIDPVTKDYILSTSYSFENGTEIYGEATKVGYTFVGWSYNGQIVKKVPAGITGVATVKLVAVYEANKYDVTFYNYVEAIEDYEEFTQEMTYDQIAKLADVASMGFTSPEGKSVFTGWEVEEGTGATVANKQVVKNLSTGAEVEFYVTWDKAAFVITYENMSCDEENVVAVNPNAVSLVDGYTTYNLLNPSMEGHIFEGWYTDPSLNGASRVYQLKQINKQGTITLYAKWSPASYRINFNLGSSDAQWSQLTVLADGTAHTIPDFASEHKHIAIDLSELAVPTLKGYVFAGWVDENGNKVEEISAVNTKTVNLTATWDLYTYTQLFVGRVYKTFLRDTINRVPTDTEIKAVLAADKEGTDYWADELGRGIQTGASFVYNLYLSKEYQAKLAKLSTKKAQYSQFIADLYMSMMGRTWNNVENYDEVGYTYWLNQMINGQKPEDVIKNFARSVEFQGICEEYGIKNIIEK